MTFQGMCHSQMEDGVVRALREAILANNVKLSTSFALQLLLEVMTILQSKKDEMLQQEKALAALDSAHYNRWGTEAPELEGDSNHMARKLLSEAKSFTVWLNMVQGQSDNNRPNRVQDIWPVQADLQRFLLLNPLACAHLELALQTRRNINILRTTDLKGTVLSTLHAYNTLKREGHVGNWEDMESLITRHKSKKLFKMDQRPEKLEECLNSARLVFTSDLLKLDDIYGPQYRKMPANKSLEEHFRPNTGLILEIIHRQLWHAHLPSTVPDLDDVEIILTAVEKDIDVNPTYKDGRLALPKAELWKAIGSSVPMTPCELLTALEGRTSSEVINAGFGLRTSDSACSLIIRVARCLEWLTELRNKLESEGNKDVPKKADEGLMVWETLVFLVPLRLHGLATDGVLHRNSGQAELNEAMCAWQEGYHQLVGSIGRLAGNRGRQALDQLEEARTACFLEKSDQQPQDRGRA